MKLKSKKSALLLSFTSLLLCFAMLAGSTFAWFTDTASTGVNKITSGNLDIKLSYKNSSTQGEFKTADKDTPVFDENARWEPGHVEYVVLKVSNEGNLALKYKLGINIAKEVGSTNVYDNPFNLSDYIRFAVLDDDKSSLDRDNLVAAATENSKLIKEGYSKEDHLLAGENNSEKIVTLVVWMPTTVDNKANHKTGEAAPSIDLGITVYATQLNHENDSFGPNYDAEAPFPIPVTANVADAEGIRAAIQQGETAGVPVKITLTGDVSGADLNGGDVTVNVAGKKLILQNTPISQGQVTIIGNEGDRLGNDKNVTVAGEGKLTMGIGISANAYQVTSFKVTEGGTLNITGGTNEHSGGKGQLITATGEGSTVNISGGNFKPSGSEFKLVEAQSGAVVNVTGGTFSCSGAGSVVFYANGGTIIISDCKVWVNGNIFQIENGGQIVVTGGTFSKDPSDYVDLNNYNVTRTGSYYTVTAK